MKDQKRKKSKYSLSTAEQSACHSIIHSASVATGAIGGGLAQLPLADNALITPIQISMIISLGKVFEQDVTKSIAKGLLAGIISSFIGRGIAQVAWGWVPGIGNASNAITAAAITETIGWISVDHFYKERYMKDKTPKEEVDYRNNSESEEGKVELKERAYEFIDGKKTRTEDLKEYMELLDAFEAALINLPIADELYVIHNKLIKIK